MAEPRDQRSAITRDMVERIEGPAPFEDSSVPFDAVEPAPTPHDVATAAAPVPSAAGIDLPAPTARGVVSLEEALARRRSIRSFTPVPLTPQELSQLLWAAQGITSRPAARTSPSAGSTHPLELYAATADGCHHYQPDGHHLELVCDRDIRSSLADAAHGETAVREAPLVVVITAVTSRTRARYGERSRRYVMIETGHAAQNLLLQAVALGLAAVPIGAFDDQQLAEALSAGPERTPLYLLAVGHPRAPEA